MSDKCYSVFVSNDQWNLRFAGMGIKVAHECIEICWDILYLHILMKERLSTEIDFLV